MEDLKKLKPMYFASLEVTNVKSFGTKQTLDLRDSEGKLSRWTLILGDNGVGKTTLLKCLAWMIPVKFPEPERFQLARKLKAKEEEKKEGKDLKWIKEFTKLSDKEWKMISNEDPSVGEIKRVTPLLDSINEDLINTIIKVGKGIRMNIEAELTSDVTLNTIPDKKNLMTIGISLARKTNEELDEIEDIENTDHLKTAEVEEFNAPNLFAYGAARHMASENFDTLEKDSTYNLLSNSGDLYDAEQVLLYLHNESVEEQNVLLREEIGQLKKNSAKPLSNENPNANSDTKPEGRATKQLRKVKEILTQLLPHIDNSDCIIINQSTKKEGLIHSKIVELITPFGKVGLYDLSLGYQTMLAWVVDFSFRMFEQNLDSNNPLEAPAVVIVDEIDLHLHPKWQRTLKEYLTSNFPATQFICTAHSPFMAQASEDENLCVLHEIKLNPTISEVHIENDPTIVKGWRIGQIATSELFGISSERKIDFEKDINIRRSLLDKIRITKLSEKEQKTLKELDEKLSKIPIQIEKTEENLRLLGKLDNISKLLKDNPDSL